MNADERIAFQVEQERHLREQLAVHAPACPDWFRPTGIPAYPDRPEVPEILDPESAAGHAARSIRFSEHSHVDESTLTDEERQTLSDLRDAMRRYREALVSRDIQYAQQRLAQWPWVYADLVLARREAGRS